MTMRLIRRDHYPGAAKKVWRFVLDPIEKVRNSWWDNTPSGQFLAKLWLRKQGFDPYLPYRAEHKIDGTIIIEQEQDL